MAYKDKARRLETQREWRKNHYLLKGICYRCFRKAFLGLTLCPRHLLEAQIVRRKHYRKHSASIRAKVAERSNRLQQEGRCRTCGIILIDEEGIFCVNCASNQTNLRGVLR